MLTCASLYNRRIERHLHSAWARAKTPGAQHLLQGSRSFKSGPLNWTQLNTSSDFISSKWTTVCAPDGCSTEGTKSTLSRNNQEISFKSALNWTSKNISIFYAKGLVRIYPARIDCCQLWGKTCPCIYYIPFKVTAGCLNLIIWRLRFFWFVHWLNCICSTVSWVTGKDFLILLYFLCIFETYELLCI